MVAFATIFRSVLNKGAIWALLATLGLAAPPAFAHPKEDLCQYDRLACLAPKPLPLPNVAVSSGGDDKAGQRLGVSTVGSESPVVDDTTEPAIIGIREETSKPSTPQFEAPPFQSPRTGQAPATPIPRAKNAQMLDNVPPPVVPVSTNPSFAATPITPVARTQLTTVQQRSWLSTAMLYIKIGFVHIVPLGLDHIVFVLALFLASTRIRPLLIQVTAFTIAHTIALALAALGLLSVAANIIEPLIALSIVFVALENILFKDMTRWRPLIIFGFGLFHGLGFAGVMAESGLPDTQFVTALVAFNIGVEFGQLAVIAFAFIPAFMLRRLLVRNNVEALYRPILVIPASILIALAGAYWAFERIF